MAKRGPFTDAPWAKKHRLALVEDDDNWGDWVPDGRRTSRTSVDSNEAASIDMRAVRSQSSKPLASISEVPTPADPATQVPFSGHSLSGLVHKGLNQDLRSTGTLIPQSKAHPRRFETKPAVTESILQPQQDSQVVHEAQKLEAVKTVLAGVIALLNRASVAATNAAGFSRAAANALDVEAAELREVSARLQTLQSTL